MGAGKKHLTNDTRGFGKYVFLAIIATSVIGLDQLTKAWVLAEIPLYRSITVVRGFFNITHVHNPGGAFGFLAGQSNQVRSGFFIVASILAISLLLYFFWKTPRTHRSLSLGFALILGGAIGNLVDRFRIGVVIDFIDLHMRHMHWPAFNIADSAISMGLVIFVFHLLLKKLPEI